MKKKWIIIVGVVVVLAIIGAVVSGGRGEDAASEQQQPQAQTEAVPTTEQAPAVEATTLQELYDEMLVAIKQTDPNTSARSDAIASFAKNAAMQKNRDIGNEAALYIANSYPDFFASNEQMEKVLLCGYYLEYLDHASRVTQLGMDVEQAVKYVYRGVEDVDSDATQENLAQIGEILEESGLK